MGRTCKGVSLAKQEALINIESPLNNTYIEPKVEEEKPQEEVKEVQEETKPKRERKKKKKAKQIERPTLITYTISGCVKNSKGRFKFTDIVDAQDENIAVDIFKQRAKKEFSAVRAINKIEISEFKEGDVKNTEEIVEDLKPSIVINSNSYTDEFLSRLVLNTILTINEQKIYKVIYAPSNKKSVIRKIPRLYYMAKDLEEMKHYLKEEAIQNTGEYNEKYIQSVQVIENGLSEEAMDTGFFRTIFKKIKVLEDTQKERLKKFYNELGTDELPEIIPEEKKQELINTLLEIPKILLDSEAEDISSSINVPKILDYINDSGLLIKEVENPESILGNQHPLNIKRDKDTGKLEEIKPVIPIIMNQNMFKTYKVHVERDGKVVLDFCDVVAESESKASDYMIFVGKKEGLIKKEDVLKIDVYLEDELIASFVCKV